MIPLLNLTQNKLLHEPLILCCLSLKLLIFLLFRNDRKVKNTVLWFISPVDSWNLHRMSGTVAVELSSSSLHPRQLGITGDGLETSHALSMKMICTNKQRLQKTVGRLEKMQGPMKKQRDDLLFLVATMEEWSLIMHESERGHSGVPILRSVKEGCNEIRPSLNSNNSQLNQTVQRLSKASVPRIAHVQKCLKDLRKEIRAVFDDENTYNGKFVEDVRETIGNVIGTSNALIALYYS